MSTKHDSPALDLDDIPADDARIALNLPCPPCRAVGFTTQDHDNRAHYEARAQANNANEQRDNNRPGEWMAYDGPDAETYYKSLCEEADARAATLAATPYQPPTHTRCPRCQGHGWKQQPVRLADALQALVNALAKTSSAAEVWEDITNTPAPTK